MGLEADESWGACQAYTVMNDFDPDLDFDFVNKTDSRAEIDLGKYQHYVDMRRNHQQLSPAIMAGVIGAGIGTMIWLGLTMFTSLQVGWMAAGIGLMVGAMIRTSGHGIDRVFGIAGVAITLAGCLIGTLLAGCWLLSAQTEEAGFAEMLLALTPGLVVEIFKAMLSPINMSYYVVGGAASYWLSIKRIKRAELAQLTMDLCKSDESDSESRAA